MITRDGFSLSLPHMNNGLSFLLTTKYIIVYWKNMKKTSIKFWNRWNETWWRHYNITMTSLIDVRLACGQHAAIHFYLPRGLVWGCEINRIHYWCSVETEKSQPEGPPFKWEMRLVKFPNGRWAQGLGFLWNHWTVMIDSFFSYTNLYLETYCIIFVGDVTEVDVYSQWRALYKRINSTFNNEQMVISSRWSLKFQLWNFSWL